jgi:hypothetical protein
MLRYLLIVVCLLQFSPSSAQQISCSPADKAAVLAKIEDLNQANLAQNDMGGLMEFIGKSFLQTPYIAQTLEVGNTESLVVNLHGLDCTTFVENVLALACMVQEGQTSFDDFLNNLETIRYYNGELKGYGSRLHYFTAWIANNQSKGLVTDITAQLGGERLEKEINFMGTRRKSYPFLQDDKNYQDILAMEARMKQHQIWVLPQDKIRAVEDKIHPGDILALATSIKGLDVTHTGLATKVNGRLHLLHASSKNKEVEVSEKPLVDYLKGIKSNIGIIVVRPR